MKARLGAGSTPRDSPDLILVEVVSSKVKKSLRPVAAWATETWSDTMGAALEQVRPQDILGRSRSCGVCATPGLKPPALLRKESS